MASIHSYEEHNFIVQMVSDEYWIGGVDFNHNGVWGWTDSSDFDYSYWLSGQPGGGEYYIIVATSAFDWRDWEYNHLKNYVCQLIL